MTLWLWMCLTADVTAEQLIGESAHGRHRPDRAAWRHIDYAQRLTWLYGPTEALRRLNAGAT